MLLQLQLDPRRGGFEILEENRSVLLVAGRSRGGPKLVEPDQAEEGDFPFVASGFACGSLEVSYDAELQSLTIRAPDTVVTVRLQRQPDVFRVRFDDFK